MQGLKQLADLIGIIGVDRLEDGVDQLSVKDFPRGFLFDLHFCFHHRSPCRRPLKVGVTCLH